MSAPLLNKVVPDFKSPATGGKPIQLKSLRGKKVVIYFYPKDHTPGCTTEGQDFRDLYTEFKRAGAEILGVSKDSVASHEKFKEKLKLPFGLLSDPDESLCRQFDVIREKSLYGRKFMGIERSTFLIDETGKLRQEWRKVRVKGHAAAVLGAVSSI